MVLDASWVTPAFIANYYQRSLRHVQRWCENGTLIEFGFKVYQAPNRRWWVKLPASMLN